ncbi:competence protein TfoX [Bacteroidia bacterium]|nr:competence protein TfoX [Bacteroidia bacterium]
MENFSTQTDLTTLPNIGPVVAQRLREVGIATAQELRAIGSENAFLRLQTVDAGACLHELMGLEGAVQGIRKYNLDNARKQELKQFYKQTQRTTEHLTTTK